MFRAPKIFKESLNATKTVTVRAAKGMKNKANLRHCRTPGDAGGGEPIGSAGPSAPSRPAVR